MNAEEKLDEMIEAMPFNLSERINPYIIEALNAFAASKLEEVREQAKEITKGNLFGPDMYLTDLNNIFDETLKELK